MQVESINPGQMDMIKKNQERYRREILEKERQNPNRGREYRKKEKLDNFLGKPPKNKLDEILKKTRLPEEVEESMNKEPSQQNEIFKKPDSGFVNMFTAPKEQFDRMIQNFEEAGYSKGEIGQMIKMRETRKEDEDNLRKKLFGNPARR